MAAIVNMEAEYLKRTVGSCLAGGLAEVAAKRPADPIEYLALWMLKYKQNTLQRTENAVRNSVHYTQQLLSMFMYFPTQKLPLTCLDREQEEEPEGDATVSVEPPGPALEPEAQQEDEGEAVEQKVHVEVRSPPPTMPRIVEEDEDSG